MSYELEGTIKLVMDEQSFPSGFRKREFVVTTEDERFPQDIKLELIKEKIEQIEGFSEGDKVKVTLRFRGREMAHQDRGMDVMNRVKEDFSDVAKVEFEPKLENRQMIMVMAPR